MLTDYRIPPASGGKAGHVVIFLHGLGDNGRGGLLSIGRVWQGALPPDTEFLCPDAPFPFDMDPSSGGRQWFSLQNLSPPGMLMGAKMAAPTLNEYIDHVLSSRALPANKLALVGFSQGTIMAIYVAARRAEPVAGIIGYSGILVGPELLAAEKKSTMPILLVHGTADEVVPYSFMATNEQALKQAGFGVGAITSPGTGHGIDDLGLMEGLKFLQKVLV